ncbi:MAG: hypothetical protein CM15mP58_22040 [Burkholderiaceae bacterium]|nr:MAG: hypothetical protein CM15mP58_22040 [Burkholderiaceae bacterium]
MDHFQFQAPGDGTYTVTATYIGFEEKDSSVTKVAGLLVQ